MAFRKITVSVLEASNLPPLDHGSVDPFCIVSIGHDRHFTVETHEIRRTTNPVWNATFKIGPVNIHTPTKKSGFPYNEICFEVKDWNRFIDKKVGRAFLKIDPLWRDGEVVERELELENTKGAKLRVSVSSRRVFSEKCAKQILREAVKCKKEGETWKDPEFPHILMPDKGVTAWSRISDLSKQPKLFDDHAAANDVIQGALGDCWLLGAMSIVATQPHLIRPLFHGSDLENGVFVVKLFVNGKWNHIVIDEFLPVGGGGGLRFGSCRDPDSFWVPLLEKAEAKLFGSYAALDGGQTSEALLDLTGEGAETIEIDRAQFQPLIDSGEVEKTLKKWKKTRFLMGASIVREGAGSEEKLANGLLCGHAYSILDIKNPVTEKGFLGLIGNKRQVLLKVRNPWGSDEWTGAWSDNSPEWTAATRKQLKHESKNDGIFWMDMEDFFANFNRLSVVRMYGTRLSIFDHKWHSFKFQGEWDEFSSGGSMNTDSWTKNPQYALDVVDKNGSTVFIYVSQPDRRLSGKQVYTNSIGCYVLRVQDNKHKLLDRSKILSQEGTHHDDAKNKTFGSLVKANADTGPVFTNKRDVGLRLELGPGSYVVMPCTFEPNVVMNFSLGVFAESRCKMSELCLEKTVGLTVELTAAGGPPEEGPLVRAEQKGADLDKVAFLHNPKCIIDFKKRRVSDVMNLSLRVEPQFAGGALIGIRLYHKTKHHQRNPLHESNLVEQFDPTGKTVFDLSLPSSDGPFIIVPFASVPGTVGKVSLSFVTSEPITFGMYY